MPPATSSHTFALSSSLVVLKTPHFFYFPEPRALQSKRLSKLTPTGWKSAVYRRPRVSLYLSILYLLEGEMGLLILAATIP